MSKILGFSPKQKQVIKAPFGPTLEVNEGTPRSGKTTAGHFRYAYYLANTPEQNHLIIAYNQEQAYRLFIEGDGTGLKHIFGHMAKLKHDDDGDHLEVITPGGVKKVYYKGGGKADSKKAITGMSLGSVVYCEIDLLHMDMIQESFRRTFASRMRYHLADLNPPAPQHPVISDVFEVQDTKWTHWTIQDNPIITEERKKELFNTLSKNPYLLQRDWYGKRVIPEGVIYSMFSHDNHIKAKLQGEPVEMYFTADGGQSDATSCSCNIVTKHKQGKKFRYKLNRVAHYYHSGSDTGQAKAMSVYAREINQFIKWCIEKFEMHYSNIFVDPACKSLREELHLIGRQTEKADNNAKESRGEGKGIEIGIERTQSAISEGKFQLIESPRYSHYNFLKEIGMYARDDKGKPIDAYNHAMDELRYSINYFYKMYIN